MEETGERGIDEKKRNAQSGAYETSKHRPKRKARPGEQGGQSNEGVRKREGGSRAPPADKMIKRQISYIIFTLMLPYRNLWEGRDLCGRVYAPQGLI